MTTRPLPKFDVASPAMPQTRQTAIDKIRENNLVMYINAALYGGIGWTGPTYTCDGQQRATQALTTNLDDTVHVRAQYAYYDSLPGTTPLLAWEGLLKSATLAYSEDGGATWQTIGTQHYTYTTDGNMLPPTWAYA
ncbi:MAG: hypothetical protein LBI35_01310 [Burkholderiales bacterium]|jgi:hypothetical protein|nr:hypothetical protein [Burkholderiales bacterium]